MKGNKESMMQLKLGIAKNDITPKLPLPLAGFARRKGNFKSINTPLYLRTFYFEQNNLIFILIIADLIWWGPELLVKINKNLQLRYNISPENIIFHATHNHSGPQTSELFSESLGKIDINYLKQLEESLYISIEEAIDNKEIVTIKRGFTNCNIGVNRRKELNGEIIIAPNYSGPVDPAVTILQFNCVNGATKGILVHYTCHPTTTFDNSISSEFPGRCCDLIENSFSKDIVVGYLQGCCANINPLLSDSDKFIRGNQKDIDKLGDDLGKKILEIILKNNMINVPINEIRIKKISIPLEYAKTYSNEELRKINNSKNRKLKMWSELLLKHPEKNKQSSQLHLDVIYFGKSLGFLAMNAEMVVEYGLFIKEVSNNSILPLSYSNGMIGYVPTEKQIVEGGYESKESIYFFGNPAQYKGSIEKEIYKNIERLLTIY